jgi:hypothetical protein
VREQSFDDELARLGARVDGLRDVDLGRAADRQARLEQKRAELQRAARERSRNASTSWVFARRHCVEECIYSRPAKHKITESLVTRPPPACVKVPVPRPMRSLDLPLPVLGFLAWAAVGLLACDGCRPAGPSAATGPTAPTSVDAGPPTARLYFVTDLAGALEPCGCTKDQLGGLDKFGAWARRGGEGEDAGRVPSLVAAAGPLFFMDEKLAPDHADQDRAKAETIARVLRRLDLAAFAPGLNDWDNGRAGLLQLANETGGRAIGNGADGAPFVSSVVRDIGGLKIGFVGYAPPGPGAPDASGPAETPQQAVLRGAEEAKAPRRERPRCAQPRWDGAKPSGSPTPCRTSRPSSSARPKRTAMPTPRRHRRSAWATS